MKRPDWVTMYCIAANWINGYRMHPEARGTRKLLCAAGFGALAAAVIMASGCDRTVEGQASFTQAKPTPVQVFVQALDHDGLINATQTNGLQDVGEHVCAAVDLTNAQAVAEYLAQNGTLGDGSHPSQQQAESIVHASQKAFCPWQLKDGAT